MSQRKDQEVIDLSVVVITKNEEDNIGECLKSVRWAKELFVIDAESLDRTVEVARQFTKNVFVRKWMGFGPQKNFGIDQASGEWILIVDADERVPDSLREEIISVVQGNPSREISGFEIPRKNFFYGRWIQAGGIYPDFQLRLFRRSAGRYDDEFLHERLRLRGRIQRLQSPFIHFSMPTIRHHVHKMMRYTTLAAREKHKVRSHVTFLNIAGNHLVTIFKTYVIRGGMRDGVHGIIVALFAGMHTFVKYVKLFEELHPHSKERN